MERAYEQCALRRRRRPVPPPAGGDSRRGAHAQADGGALGLDEHGPRRHRGCPRARRACVGQAQERLHMSGEVTDFKNTEYKKVRVVMGELASANAVKELVQEGWLPEKDAE